MRLRRLGWAGLELEVGAKSLVIDHMLDPGILGAFFGEERDELIAPEPGRASAALLTHLHRDHADVPAIKQALGPDGFVLRPARKRLETELDEVATGEAEVGLADSGLDVRAVEPGDTFEVGPFEVTALRASDGLGSPQVSWLVAADGVRLVHAGDTLWHGGWWDVAAAHGPVDVACMPANGVEISYPGWEPAVSVPAVMSPDQAVEASRALKARTLLPIHYNRTFEHSDYYRPFADAREQLERFADERAVTLRFLRPGDWTEVATLSGEPSAR